MSDARHGDEPRTETATVSVDPRVAEVISAATAVRESEGGTGRARHVAHVRLYNALDALPTLESVRPTATAEPASATTQV